MFIGLSILISLIIGVCSLYVYLKTKDGTHPAIMMSPMMIYMYAFTPILAYKSGDLHAWFSEDMLNYVAILNMSTILCLYIGLTQGRKPAGTPKLSNWHFLERPRARKKIYNLALLLGGASVTAYAMMIIGAGGFIEAYSTAKAYLGGRSSSGYVGEALNLSFAAVILLALARHKRRIRAGDILLCLLIISPQLLHGTFGGRRGPLFLSLTVLFLAWFVAKGRLPSAKTGLIAVCLIGLAVIFVWSQRQNLYIGSESGVEIELFEEKITGEEVNQGNTFVAGAATIITADYFSNYYWGYRYFVTFFVRPIPKQIWPTKYEDMGADWLYRYGDEIREARFHEALGFFILPGAGTGSIADGYREFWWGVLALFYLIGRLYGTLWRRHKLIGGFWTVLFISALIMSIYLATQSVPAWAIRVSYIGAATFLAWRYLLNLPLQGPSRNVRRVPVSA